MSADCIFCRIGRGEMDADIVHSGDEVVAFRDINPQAPVHVQVVPKRHVAHIADFDPSQDTPWLTELFEVANRVAESEGLGEGYRLVMNNGAKAGQSVAHVHLHVLGGRQLRWPPG